MKYLFRRTADGATIMGETPNSVFPGKLWIEPIGGDMVHFRNLDGSAFNLGEKNAGVDVKTLKKENDTFYADINDFNAVSGTFFFSSGINGTTVTLGNFRIIATETGLRIDKKLTATGFAGVENTDWETLNIFN